MHTHFRAAPRLPLCRGHSRGEWAAHPACVRWGGRSRVGLGEWAHAERGAVRACGCVEGGALDVVVVGARAARGMPRWRWQGVGRDETREAWCRGGRWPGLRGSEGEALHCAVQRASIIRACEGYRESDRSAAGPGGKAGGAGGGRWARAGGWAQDSPSSGADKGRACLAAWSGCAWVRGGAGLRARVRVRLAVSAGVGRRGGPGARVRTPFCFRV